MRFSGYLGQYYNERGFKMAGSEKTSFYSQFCQRQMTKDRLKSLAQKTLLGLIHLTTSLITS